MPRLSGGWPEESARPAPPPEHMSRPVEDWIRYVAELLADQALREWGGRLA
jgi:hypothetical protein